jgi:hypothetical protein
MNLQWWSIEVRDGAFPAAQWRNAHDEFLAEAALTHGARTWNWVILSWGVVLEVGFVDDEDWIRFRHLPAVQAALDAVPDPVGGLVIYPGRGGMSGAPMPRRPRPSPLAGAAPLPESVDPPIIARLGRGATASL